MAESRKKSRNKLIDKDKIRLAISLRSILANHILPVIKVLAANRVVKLNLANMHNCLTGLYSTICWKSYLRVANALQQN